MKLPLPIEFKFNVPNSPLGIPGQMSKLWQPRDLILDVKAFRELAYRQKFKGPFLLVMSGAWIPILDLPFNARNFLQHPNLTKRVGDVIKALPGIKDIATTDQLGAYGVVMYEV